MTATNPEIDLPSPLLAVTLWQPWAWAMIWAGKDVENRPGKMGSPTGWIAVHVGMHWRDDYVQGALDDMRQAAKASGSEAHCLAAAAVRCDALRSQLGSIIGFVDIARWAPRSELLHSPWTQRSPGYGAVVRNRIALPTQVMCRDGFHRGVWRVPASVEQQIREQL